MACATIAAGAFAVLGCRHAAGAGKGLGLKRTRDTGTGWFLPGARNAYFPRGGRPWIKAPRVYSRSPNSLVGISRARALGAAAEGVQGVGCIWAILTSLLAH